MDNRRTRFSHNGETVDIYPGYLLPKNEIIARLKEMGFISVDSSYERKDLIYIYEIALNYDNNKIKIFNRLKKDTIYFESKNDLNKRNIFNEDISFDKDIKNNHINSYNSYNDDESDSNNESSNSSFCLKILRFINEHKIDILEKLFYLIIYFSIDSFLKNLAKSNFILGKIINYFRSKVTPRRALLGFLLYYIAKYVLNTLFIYLFGFGILTIIYILYKDKFNDFLLSVL